MKRLLSLSFLLLSLPVLGALSTFDESRDLLALPQKNIITRNVHGPLNVFHGSDGFIVAHNAKLVPVKSYDVGPGLRNMDANKAAKVLAATQLQVSRLNSGEYTIAQHGQLNGGGVILANVAYYGVNALCYGTAAAAGGAVIVATGGVAGGLGGAALAGATTGLSAGGGLVAGTIAGAGLTAEAVTITTAVVVTQGAATVGLIEGLAIGLAALAANPLLP